MAKRAKDGKKQSGEIESLVRGLKIGVKNQLWLRSAKNIEPIPWQRHTKNYT